MVKVARFLFVFELLWSEGRGLVSFASRPAAWLQPPASIAMPGSPAHARTAPQKSRPLFEADPGEVFIELLYQARGSVLIAPPVKKLCLVFRICLTCFSQTLRTPVLRPLPRAKASLRTGQLISTNHDFGSYLWPRLSRHKRSARVSSRRVARLSGTGELPAMRFRRCSVGGRSPRGGFVRGLPGTQGRGGTGLDLSINMPHINCTGEGRQAQDTRLCVTRSGRPRGHRESSGGQLTIHG